MRQLEFAGVQPAQPCPTYCPTSNANEDGPLSNLPDLFRVRTLWEDGRRFLCVYSYRSGRLDRLDTPSNGAGFRLPNLAATGWAGRAGALPPSQASAVAAVRSKAWRVAGGTEPGPPGAEPIAGNSDPVLRAYFRFHFWFRGEAVGSGVVP